MTWASTKQSLEGFGGAPATLYVRKTGLPFFDALRLYGAIDLEFRLSGETKIRDEGSHWRIDGTKRELNAKRMERLIDDARTGIAPKPKGKSPELAANLAEYLRSFSSALPTTGRSTHQGTGSFAGLDSVLQSGMRGTAAQSYDTLQSGNTSAKECLAEVGLFDGLLAVAGWKRTDAVGDLFFLPIFEGKIDFSKVVCPLRAWLGIPTPVCAQALMLLALESSLFSEGYQQRLSAIVYNRRVSRGEFSYSGVMDVSQTALTQAAEAAVLSADTVAHLYACFRAVCSKGWNRGRSTEFTGDVLAMAYWVIHPRVHKNLRSLITSQERLRRNATFGQLFNASNVVEEIFHMTHGKERQVNQDECRKFAKAVAKGIYIARMKDHKEHAKARKAWYDEVTLLRSATRAPQFFRRALILIEQGHREDDRVGRADDQKYDPTELEQYYRQCDPREFEIFRDLFRMHLIQQSGPTTTGKADAVESAVETDVDIEASDTQEQPE